MANTARRDHVRCGSAAARYGKDPHMRIKREGPVRQPVRRRRLQALATCAAAAAITVGLSPAPAAAVSLAFIKHGSDTGELLTNGDRVACDKEADGRAVYVQVNSEHNGLVKTTDSTGADGVCVKNSSSWQLDPDYIEWIRVCEKINNWPDDCTDKLYL